MKKMRDDGTGRDNLDLAMDYTRMGAQALCITLTVISAVLATMYYFEHNETHVLLAAIFAWSMMVVPGILSRFRHKKKGRKRRLSRSSRDVKVTSNDLIKEAADWLFILWGLGSLFVISYASGVERRREANHEQIFASSWCFAIASIFGHYFSKENKECSASQPIRYSVTARQLENLRSRARLFDNYDMLKSVIALVSGIFLFAVSDEFSNIQTTAIVFTLLYALMYVFRKGITILICNNCCKGIECGRSKIMNLTIACIAGLFQFNLLGQFQNEWAWLASSIFILSLVVEHYNVRFKCDKKSK